MPNRHKTDPKPTQNRPRASRESNRGPPDCEAAEPATGPNLLWNAARKSGVLLKNQEDCSQITTLPRKSGMLLANQEYCSQIRNTARKSGILLENQESCSKIKNVNRPRPSQNRSQTDPKPTPAEPGIEPATARL